MIQPFSLNDVLSALPKTQSAQLNEVAQRCDVSIQRVHTDTRTLQVGDLFVALSGDNFDGHDYIESAITSGAVAALVQRDKSDQWQALSVPLIVVEDVLLALGQLSAWHRGLFEGPVMAITGSAGKTTVKHISAELLSYFGKCWSTPGNFNNHIGVPLTLLSLESDHDALVVELGASGAGEIAYTSQFAKPKVAVLTNASGAHIEGFGSLDVIVQTKGEIIDALPNDGTAILNKDDPYFETWSRRAGDRHVISFGTHEAANVRAVDIELTPEGSRFNIVLSDEITTSLNCAKFVPVFVPLMGQHNVLNALAAASAAIAFKVPMAYIVEKLAVLVSVPGRLQIKAGKGQIHLIDDSYNASPASVKAAIDVLAMWQQDAVLVLGDMGELGDESFNIHREIGTYARDAKIPKLLATGPASRATVEAFGASAQWFDDKNTLIEKILTTTNTRQYILVKGSRSSGMDQVVDALSNTQKIKGE